MENAEVGWDRREGNRFRVLRDARDERSTSWSWVNRCPVFPEKIKQMIPLREPFRHRHKTETWPQLFISFWRQTIPQISASRAISTLSWAHDDSVAAQGKCLKRAILEQGYL